MISICIAGDFFPGGVLINKNGFCTDEVRNFLNSFDVRVATLESAIGENLGFDPEKMQNPAWRNVIYSPNKGIELLKKINIDIVTLANNHIFDLGEEGLINTIRLLDKYKIKHCGAGIDIEDARKPAVIRHNDKQIAFLSYMVYFDGWRAPHPAKKKQPGINIFDLQTAIEDVKKAKERYDYVFILPHWGTEYSIWPTVNDIKYAKEMINAGADGVFGSHAHIKQPIIKYSNKPIFYNLGNFIFPDFYMNIDRTVYYPLVNEDMRDVQISYSYERYPQTKLLRKWPVSYRKGLLASLYINGKIIKYKGIPIIINNDNIVCFDNDNSLKLNILGFCIKFMPYNVLYRYRYIFDVKNKIQKIFSKLINH